MTINGKELDVLIREASGYRFEKDRADAAIQLLRAVVASNGPITISELSFHAAKGRQDVDVDYNPSRAEFILSVKS